MDTPVIGMIGGVIAVAIAISVGGTILATTTDQCVDVIYTEGVPDPDPVEWEPYWVVREDRIDDASYWREPFTELPQHDPDSSNNFLGSRAWENRHVYESILAECQCPQVGEGANSDCLDWVARAMHFNIMYDNDIDQHCGTDADMSFFGAAFTEDDGATGYGAGGSGYFTLWDDCRAQPLSFPGINNNNAGVCLVESGNWDPDTNPAVVDPLLRSDYLRVYHPQSADQIAEKYAWVTTCDTAESTILTGYSVITIIILLAVAAALIMTMRYLLL